MYKSYFDDVVGGRLFDPTMKKMKTNSIIITFANSVDGVYVSGAVCLNGRM